MKSAAARCVLRSISRPQGSTLRYSLPTPPRSSSILATRSSLRPYSTAPEPTPTSDTAPPPPQTPEVSGELSQQLSESQAKQAEAEKKSEELQVQLDELKVSLRILLLLVFCQIVIAELTLSSRKTPCTAKQRSKPSPAA